MTPAAGAHLSLRPSVRSIPESRPRGKQPPGESGPTRAHTPPPVATRDGSGRETAARAARGGGTRGGAPPLGRHGTARERPHAHAHARTRTHARAPRTGRRPGPAGSSPDSEGGGAGRGRQRAVLSPTAGPADPSRRGGSAQHATVVTPHRWPLHAEEGPQLGVSSTPRHPLGSLEKAFSPRVHRPHPFVPRPGPTKRRPKGRQGLGGGGRSAARGRHRAILSAHSRGPPRRPSLPRRTRHARISAGKELRASREATRGGDRHGMLLGKETTPLGWPSTTAPARPAAIAHTPRHVQAPPRSTACARGTTRRPQPHGGGGGWASLTDSTARSSDYATNKRWPEGVAGNRGRRRRSASGTWDDLERSRGTTEGQAQRAQHAQAVSSAASGRPSPWRGGPLTTRSQERQARVSAASEDPGPTDARRQNAGGRGRAGVHTPPPAPSPHRHSGRRRRRRRRSKGPAGRTRRAVPFAMNVRPSSDAA